MTDGPIPATLRSYCPALPPPDRSDCTLDAREGDGGDVVLAIALPPSAAGSAFHVTLTPAGAMELALDILEALDSAAPPLDPEDSGCA